MKEERTEIVHGVTIVSRHGIEREFLRMRRSVESLPKQLREQIVEFFCDSKVGDHYGIFLRSRDSAQAILPFLPPLRASSVVFFAGRSGCWSSGEADRSRFPRRVATIG